MEKKYKNIEELCGREFCDEFAKKLEEKDFLKECQYCGEVIPIEIRKDAKFCSKSCKSKFNMNKLRKKDFIDKSIDWNKKIVESYKELKKLLEEG